MKKFLFTKKMVGVLGVLIALSFVVQGVLRSVDAAVTITGISGFAWSDMPDTSNEAYPSPQSGAVGRGAGWISMNTTLGTSAGYGGNVTVDASGNLIGYAWTPNMGYIRFDPDGPYPESNPGAVLNPINPGTPVVPVGPSNGGNGSQGPVTPGGGFLPTIFKRLFNAETAYAYSSASRIDLSTGKWSGFARACAVFQNPSACTGALASNDITGGWDGWISLRGAIGNALTDGYGVQTNLTTGVTAGWAWGGDIMGWITFEDVFVHLTTPNDLCVDIPGEQDQAYLVANGLTSDSQTKTCLPPPAWCTDGVDNNGNGLIDSSDPLECPQNLPWCTDGVDNNGNGLIDQADPTECPSSGSNPCTDGVDNNNNGLVDSLDPLECPVPPPPAPAVTLTASSLDCGAGTVNLSWTSANVASGSCSATTSGGAASGFSGSVGTSNSGLSVSGIQVGSGPYVFTISCSSPSGAPATSTQTVSCVPSVPCQPGQACDNKITPIIKER